MQTQKTKSISRIPEELLTISERYEKKKIRKILYLDLETMIAPRFSGEWGQILCYVARVRDTQTNKIEEFVDWRFPDLKKHMNVKKPEPYKNDLPLLEQISYLFEECDLAIGHFGRFFDFPYFKTRCWTLGRKDLVPKYHSIKFGDTWLMSKKSNKLISNKLDSIAKAFDKVKWSKTEIHPMVWQAVIAGNKKAMDYCVIHCIEDVKMLEQIHRELEHSVAIPSSYI